MAITICSSPNPILSSLKTLYSLQSPTLSTPSSSFSYSKFGLGFVSDDALVIATASAEAMALASTALLAARDAVSSADVLFYKERENELERDGRNVVGVRRRKKRMKRRKGLEFLEMEKNRIDGEDQQVLFRFANSRRLTRKEEAEFSLCLKEGARLEAVKRRITEPGEHEPTSNQWAKAAGLKRSRLDRKLCNGRESRERITCSYRRLVVSIAAGYQGRGLSLQDLIQEGSIGLLRGAERFDPERGYKLSTYVYWWIKQAIIRAIANKSRVVRLPVRYCTNEQFILKQLLFLVVGIFEPMGVPPTGDDAPRGLLCMLIRVLLFCRARVHKLGEWLDIYMSNRFMSPINDGWLGERGRWEGYFLIYCSLCKGSMCERLAKIAKVSNVLSKRLRRLPTYDEIAEMLNVRVSTVKLVSERSRPPISLDGVATDRGCMRLQEIIPGPEETMPETMVKKQLMKQAVEKFLNALNEIEAHIVRLHFGLNGGTPQSFEEIGRLSKLSRERVRQINGIALSKLQQTSIVDNLKIYLM